MPNCCADSFSIRFDGLKRVNGRSQRVYVLGAPEVQNGAVRIYLDVESNPEEGYVYLVGMIVCDGRGEDRYSF